MSHAFTCTRHHLSGGACRSSLEKSKVWKRQNFVKSIKKICCNVFFPDFLRSRSACIIYLRFILSIERLLDFYLTSQLNNPDLRSLLFSTKTHILTNKATPRQGRGAASISNAPEIPDILIPWDLLSYLLWESEFMMSKLGSFICVPGGLQHAAEMA